MLDTDLKAALEGQPAPAGRDGSVSVTDAAIQLLESRRQDGIGKYGVELLTNNGRDPLADAVLEAADLFLYLLQKYLEEQQSPQSHEDAPKSGEEYGHINTWPYYP